MTEHRKVSLELNTLIDRLLLSPHYQLRQRLVELVNAANVTMLGERVRRRATLLTKRNREQQHHLLQVRNELILALYAALIPPGWSCGWSDGAIFYENAERHAGIGGLLMDHDGNVIECLSEESDSNDAFGAELAAVAAVIDIAIENQQSRLWLYCDNPGLVQLWHEHHDDPRLTSLRKSSARLEKFALRVVPRLHNQPAHTLARAAVKKSLVAQSCREQFATKQ